MLRIYLLFTLSGAAGLMYQVVWSRLLDDIFGVSVYAVTTVLATFLAGLALGSVVLGRAADRSRDPLRWYGVLEIGIALAAWGGTWLIGALEPAHIWAANQFAPDSAALLGVRVLLASTVILPATFLMGGTLPVITRFFVDRIQRLGREISLLYALNTLGAVVGSLVAGFVLIRLVGLHPTVWIAGAINLLVGAVCLRSATTLALHRKGRKAGRAASAAIVTKDDPGTPGATFGLLIVVGLSGFVSLGLEVFWTRVLVLIVGTTTYAFVTMLSSFLVGITLGSFIMRLVGDRIRHPRRAFGWVQIGIAASTLATLPVMGHLSAGVAQGWLEGLSGNWVALIAARFGVSFLIMLVPTTFVGMTFPLAARIWAREMQSLSGRLGQIYGANAFGNILGAALSGFLLLPLIGLQRGIAVLATLALANAAWGLFPAAADRRRVVAGLRAAPVVVGVAVCALLLLTWTPKPFLLAGEREGDHVLYYKEGLVATVKVIQKQRDASQRWMAVDAVIIGESSAGVDQKQQALAHFPFLLMPDRPPARILSVGLGTGILIGEVARHPSVRVVDCIEISPAVIEAARLFDEHNGGVLDHPAVRIINDDGVNYLRRRDERYDAIISDAKSRTAHAGNSLFFSADYYELCLGHLEPGGLMIQWVPLEVPPAELRTIFRTFASVFPHAYVWLGPHQSCFLVGTAQRLALDMNHIERVLRAPATARLRHYGWRDANSFVSMLVAGHAMFEAWDTDDVAINTLEHPVLEFYSPRDYATPVFRRVAQNLAAIRGAGGDPFAGLTLVGADETALATHRRAVAQLFAGLEQVGTRDANRVRTGLDLLEQALRSAPDNSVLRYTAAIAYYELAQSASGDAKLRLAQRAAKLWPGHAYAQLAVGRSLVQQRKYSEAVAALRRALENNSRLADAQVLLARALAALGQDEEAIEHYRRGLEIIPAAPFTLYWLGRSQAAVGRRDEAVESYRAALSGDAANADIRFHLGSTLARLGRMDEAIKHLQEAVRLKPNDAAAHGALGLAFARQGKHVRAADEYRAALGIRSEWPLLENGLARLLATSPSVAARNGDAAVRLAEGLCRRGGFRVPAQLDTLAAAYAEVGRFADAIAMAKRAQAIAGPAGQTELVKRIATHIELYESQKPLREETTRPAP